MSEAHYAVSFTIPTAQTSHIRRKMLDVHYATLSPAQTQKRMFALGFRLPYSSMAPRMIPFPAFNRCALPRNCVRFWDRNRSPSIC
jgi:hypothetical protein